MTGDDSIRMRGKPETEPHVFVTGKYATQCARCFLREHNPIHTPPPTEKKSEWDMENLMPGYRAGEKDMTKVVIMPDEMPLMGEGPKKQ